MNKQSQQKVNELSKQLYAIANQLHEICKETNPINANDFDINRLLNGFQETTEETENRLESDDLWKLRTMAFDLAGACSGYALRDSYTID